MVKIAEENPDLTYKFIKDLLISQQERAALKLESYRFEEEPEGF